MVFAFSSKSIIIIIIIIIIMKTTNKLQFNYLIILFLLTVGLTKSAAQIKISPGNNFENLAYKKIGKGECSISDGILVSRDAYASFGNAEWQNYRMSFEARVPKTEEQVQIWFSLREQGRNERYLIGFKGGLQNDIEIGRMGLMGADAFLYS